MLENIQTDKSGVYECSAMNAAVDLMGKVIKASQSIQVSVVCKYIYVLVTFISRFFSCFYPKMDF
jgi:hypothetical protein